jgi:hypothetical protein
MLVAFVIHRLEFVIILKKMIIPHVMMEIDVHKRILAYLESALELIQLFVLHLINATLLDHVIHQVEHVVILQRIMELIAMMEINVLKPILVNMESVLDLIQLFVLL